MDRFTKVVLSIVSILVLVIIIIVLIATSNKENDYDISMMKEVDVAGILDMFEDKGTYVLLMGSETCDVCKRLIPKMAEAQKELNYTTRYIDILSIDFESSTWAELEKKLDMKSTQTTTEDGTGEEITESYGYFIKNYAFAPTVIIIKDGKQTGGFIGGVEQDELISWLREKIS